MLFVKIYDMIFHVLVDIEEYLRIIDLKQRPSDVIFRNNAIFKVFAKQLLKSRKTFYKS